MSTADWYEPLLDSGYVPDFLLREGIRHLLGRRLASLRLNEQPHFDQQHATKMDFINELKFKPIAVHTKKANEQHYEVSTEFLKMCLGPRMKYSCCLFPDGIFHIISILISHFFL
jgi:cyclopropane-fatty-acyl-phospholipid synthase